MDDQISQTTFDPKIYRLISKIRKAARQAQVVDGPSDARLRMQLDRLVEKEFDSVKNARERIIDDINLHDFLLDYLGTEFSKRLVQGSVDRQYVIGTICTSCAESEHPRRKRHSLGRQVIPVDRYIREAEFLDGTVYPEFKAAGLQTRCPSCDEGLQSTYSSNIMVPQQQQIVRLISQRVKSSGQYCEKLVDRIFFDPADKFMTQRDIIDRYANMFVVQCPQGASPQETRQRFLELYGIKLADRGNIEHQLCYGMRDVLVARFGVLPEEVQDNIKDPKRRMVKNRMVVFKMLQFPVRFQNKLFEGKIVSSRYYEKEIDRKSAAGYVTYRQIENNKRQEMFRRMPEALVVYEALMSIFPEKPRFLE
jgi:hypothetical protein